MLNYLSVAVLPSLTTRPRNQTILEATNVTFHCTATGNPVPKVTWIKDGKILAKGETLSFTTNRNQSGVYWCAADNGLNSTVNASALLDVQCKYNDFSGKSSATNSVVLSCCLLCFSYNRFTKVFKCTN